MKKIIITAVSIFCSLAPTLAQQDSQTITIQKMIDARVKEKVACLEKKLDKKIASASTEISGLKTKFKNLNTTIEENKTAAEEALEEKLKSLKKTMSKSTEAANIATSRMLQQDSIAKAMDSTSQDMGDAFAKLWKSNAAKPGQRLMFSIAGILLLAILITMFISSSAVRMAKRNQDAWKKLQSGSGAAPRSNGGGI